MIFLDSGNRILAESRNARQVLARVRAPLHEPEEAEHAAEKS